MRAAAPLSAGRPRGRVLVLAVTEEESLRRALRRHPHERLVLLWGSRPRGLPRLRSFLARSVPHHDLVRVDDTDLTLCVGRLLELVGRTPGSAVRFHCGEAPPTVVAAMWHVGMLLGIPLTLDAAAGPVALPTLQGMRPADLFDRDQRRVLRLLFETTEPIRQTRVARRLRLVRQRLVPRLEALSTSGLVDWQRSPPARLVLTPIGRTLAPLLLDEGRSPAPAYL